MARLSLMTHKKKAADFIRESVEFLVRGDWEHDFRAYS